MSGHNRKWKVEIGNSTALVMKTFSLDGENGLHEDILVLSHTCSILALNYILTHLVSYTLH